MLIISDEFIRYINDARNVSSQSGLQKGDFIIDLSGQSPGLIYLMGAKSLGTAWNTGGYKGSLDTAKAYFNTTYLQSIGAGASDVVSGSIATAAGLETFFDNLRTSYNSARDNTITLQVNVCHASCHSSCHSSRGRR